MTAARRPALEELLLAMADDEFVLGFSDSEWTGIAPILEEDVAISSLAQDELGHARALYELLAGLTGSDADHIAYDRPADAYRHARLLDHGRGDWATTIARRYLYDTADAVRLEALAGSSERPLAELVAKIRREETYHLLHAETWLDRLASAGGEPRQRLLAALALLGPDATSVLAPLEGEAELVADGILPQTGAVMIEDWLGRIRPALDRLGLPLPDRSVPDPERARRRHGEAFAWLHDELGSVRRLDPAAAW